MGYYYTRDHLGSVRELCDGSGNKLTRYSYDPYGRTTASYISGSTNATFQYARMYTHQTSGLYLTKYRAYDPNTGRWLSRDPIGIRGGINLYGYVGNDPIYWNDPSGLTPAPGLFTVLGGAAGVVITAAGSIVVDVYTGGVNIAATPAELAVGGGYGAAGGAAIDIWLHHPSASPAAGTSCPMAQTDRPPFVGPPGSTDVKPKQTRKYGPDGYPETDVDTGHDHGAGDPHAHDWTRPPGGGPPTAEDRQPGRPLQPGDPPPPPNSPPPP